MRCGAARKHLYVLGEAHLEDAARPVPADAAHARAHLAQCAACRDFFAAERQLKNLLKERAAGDQASTALRERILSGIASQQARGRGHRARTRWLMAGLAGMLVLLALVGGLWLQGRRDTVLQRLTALLVEDHSHNLSRHVEFPASDHAEVQSWFRGKVDFAFRLPASRDTSLIGGRLCNLQGRRAALIQYRHLQSPVSLFIFDGSDLDLPDDQLIALDGRRCLVEARKGYNVVVWKDRDLIYGFVSDLRSADLLQLTAEF